jgi:GGDEF domain-containing protein
VALAEAERGDHQVTVMCLDVNGFKEVNDSLGHEAGDRLLELIAGRPRSFAGTTPRRAWAGTSSCWSSPGRAPRPH